MVFVDIRIPQLAKTYDFRLDEKTETAVLIRQISVILFGKEVQGALFDLTLETDPVRKPDADWAGNRKRTYAAAVIYIDQ